MKKIQIKLKNILSLAVFLLLLVLPVISFAQTVTIPPPTGNNVSILGLLGTLLNNVVLPIGAVLVVMYVIYAGFTFVTAQGKPKEIEEAQRRLLWALIGGGILLGAVGIKDFVVTTVEQILPNVKF